MKVGIDQTQSIAPQSSSKSRISQLRRVRTSKTLAFDADEADFRMSGSSSMATQCNPTALFSEYLLGAHKAHEKPHHGSNLLPRSGSKPSHPNETQSTSGGSSRPLIHKGASAPESNTTSLVAMIQGIFGGREPKTSQTHPRPNLNLPIENAFDCLASNDSLPGHSIGCMMFPTRESRQEDGSSDGSSGSSQAGKPRSKGIPIQRSPPTHETLDDDSTSSESPDDACKETYDWATWRMYNRINDHRAKYPVNARYMSNQHYGASGRSPRFASRFVDTTFMPIDDLRSQLLRGDTPMMDGEVFHLEM